MADSWFRRRKGLFTKDMGYGYMPINKEGVFLIIFMMIMIAIEAYFFISVKYTAISFIIALAITIILSILSSDYKCNEPYIFKRGAKQ